MKGKGKWKKEVFLQAGKGEDFTQRGREFWTLKDQGRAGTKARRQRSRKEGARHHGSRGHIGTWGAWGSSEEPGGARVLFPPKRRNLRQRTSVRSETAWTATPDGKLTLSEKVNPEGPRE